MDQGFDSVIFPQEVDRVTRETPSKPFASIPKENWMQDGWRDLSYALVANSINVAAQWLDETLGKANEFPTFMYFGPNDLRYTFLLGGGMKSKRKVMFPDIYTLTDAGLQHLLDATQCVSLLCTEGHDEVFKAMAQKNPNVTVHIVPSYESFLDSPNVAHYPFDQAFSEILDEPFQIVHTSGTTGTPKIMTLTHRKYSRYQEAHKYPVEKGEQLNSQMGREKRILVTFPFYWAVGLLLTSITVPTHRHIPVVLPTDAPKPMTAAYLTEIQQHADFQAGIYAPSVLKEFAKSPNGVEVLGKLDFVWFSGAQIDEFTGSVLSPHVYLGSLLGSTENGLVATYVNDNEDFQYVRIHPLSGIQMEYREEDGMYEMVYHKRPDRPQGVFLHFPHLDQHRTRDLFEAHPRKKGLFRHMGRLDDFVKLSHLDRFRGAEIEQELEKNNMIKTALMGGDGRSKPFALIEVAEADAQSNGARDVKQEVWEVIDAANKSSASQIRIPGELVIFSDPKRPFPRLAKGTLNRRATLALYDQDISNAYEAIGE